MNAIANQLKPASSKWDMRIVWCLFFLLAGGFAGNAQSLPDNRAAFQFRNNFWVNLHHFVRAEARRRTMGGPPLLPLTSLPEDERHAWSGALDAYADLAKASLIFDQDLVRINNALTGLGSRSSLQPDVVEPKIAAALNAAAPIYRTHLWHRQQADNEHWIAEFAPLAQERAGPMIRALAAAYHVGWPAGPIIVDLASETGPTLAYTTDGPPGTAGHTVLAPLKASDRDVAFEILFHEASHVVDAQITDILQREGERQHVEVPKDLWHALIFYTSGEIARRDRGKQRDAAYRPYAYRFHVYEAPGWGAIRAALERDWQPYLDGKLGFDAAVHNLVRDVSR